LCYSTRVRARRTELFERLRERKKSAEDLYELKLCRESSRKSHSAGLGGTGLRYGPT